MENGIPARIIQTAKHGSLPMFAKAAVANLKSLNPNFEYLFFDNEGVSRFIQKEFPEYLDIFENFPRAIQKYDFFRYLAVFRLGGFYFDMDVFLVAGIGELLSKRCIFPFEQLTVNRFLRQNCEMDWEIGNFAFGATAGHPFLKAVIENCVRAQRDTAWMKPMMLGIPLLFRSDFYVLNTTGPGLVSRTFAESSDATKDVTILFPDDVCNTATWHQFGEFGIHAMDGSWRNRRGYLRRRLSNLWESWSSHKGLKASRQRGKTRSLILKKTTTPVHV